MEVSFRVINVERLERDVCLDFVTIDRWINVNKPLAVAFEQGWLEEPPAKLFAQDFELRAKLRLKCFACPLRLSA